MATYTVLLGNFGSGKSEIAINMALNAAKKGTCALLDLDLVNPYFRSSERFKLLEGGGVKLIAPPFALKKQEIMAVSPEVFSVFTGAYDTVIFDAGGDGNGALSLGQYAPYFAKIDPSELEVLFVVNPMRPLAENATAACALLRAIERSSRLTVSGLVNNGNLASETSVDELKLGYKVCCELSEMTSIPVRMTCGKRQVLDEFFETHTDEGMTGKRHDIEIFMHRDWESYTIEGL